MYIKLDLRSLLIVKEKTIFKWKKSGLHLKIGGGMINLDLEDRNIVIGGLQEMLEQDISYSVRIGIEEAIEYLTDNT